MELLYTSRYKINFLFSIFISGFITGLIVLIGPYLNGSFHGNIRAVTGALIYMALHFYFTRKYRRRKRTILSGFPEEWEEILLSCVHFYVSLDDEDKLAFRKRVQIFLSEKRITGIGVDVDEKVRVLTAAAAIIPVFRIAEWEYDSVDEILIYPDSFDTSFNQEGDDRDVLGMVIQNTSSVIISKKALFAGFSKLEGHNTAIHEFLHKIDEGDGEIDGLPALMLSREEVTRWRKVVEDEMAAMEEGRSDFNRYGLTNEAEFFAVAGEYFFERPYDMKRKHEKLYELMRMAFRQDERFVLKDEILKTIGKKKKKLGRNAPCPCGSGKKYKKCCMGKDKLKVKKGTTDSTDFHG